MLARVAELEIEYSPIVLMGYSAAGYTAQEQLEKIVPNLYDPANMALAWRCHLWACNNQFNTNTWPYLGWFEDNSIFEYEDAQRRWLDKVLELAIEAGVVEVMR